MNTAIVITFLTRCLYFIWVIFLNPHGSPNLHHRCKNQDMDRWGNPPEITHVRQNQCWKPGASMDTLCGAVPALVAIVGPPAHWRAVST